MKALKKSSRVSNALIGAAGVHFVVSELSRRGLIALPTVRNTVGMDIVATNTKGTWHANLQIKTSQKKVKFWPVGEGHRKFKGSRNYYVFLRYLQDESRFEAFLESSKNVSAKVGMDSRRRKTQGYKWVSFYYAKDDSALTRLTRRWNNFGKGK